MQIAVYIINLDRRPERWKSVSSHLLKLGIAGERISAIDAREIATAEDLPIGSNSNISENLISRGDRACALSHIKAMEKFLQSDNEFALILEDDVELASDLPELLRNTDWIPHPHTLVNFEVNIEAEYLLGRELGRTPNGREIREMYRFQYGGGSAAYLMSRKAASVVTAEARILDLQIGHRLFDMSYSSTSRKLRPIQVLPAMARQRRPHMGGFVSDIFDTNESNKRWKQNQKTVTNRLRRLPFRCKLLLLRMLKRAQKLHVCYVSEINNIS